MLKLRPCSKASLAAALTTALCLSSEARVLSVNVAEEFFSTTAIEGGETFGYPALNAVVGYWNNVVDSGLLLRDDGSASRARAVVNPLGGYGTFAAGYANTPLLRGAQHYATTPDGTSLTVAGLDGEFPEGYVAIVYLTGYVANTGASITDGTSTYYFRPLNPAPATFTATDLAVTTTSSLPVEGAFPVAQVAVFGTPASPLHGTSFTATVDVLHGGGVGIGGIQLVDARRAAGGVPERTWTDPALGKYFLDATLGDDANDGRSPATAWKSLSRLNSLVVTPGDVILFKAGEVFVGGFTLVGTGSAENPVIFGAYGTGPRPRLQGGASNAQVMRIGVASGIIVRDLQFSNYHPTGTIADRHGIRVLASPGAGDMRRLHFHDLDFVDIAGSGPNHESRGIDAETAQEATGVTPSRWNGFIIERCQFRGIDGRAVQVNDFSHSLADARIRGTTYYPTIGFVFQDNVGYSLTRNLLQLQGTDGAIIQRNACSGTREGSAFWPFDTHATLVQFNDFRHLRNENADAYICHYDYNCTSTLMQYNFGYDVDGGLIEIIVLSDFQFFQEDAVARYNIGIDVGFRSKDNAAAIFLTGRVTRSLVHNNTAVFTGKHPAYKALSVRDWGAEFPNNNRVHNNLFLRLGGTVSYVAPEQYLLEGNVLSHNLYHGFAPPSQDRAPRTGDPRLVAPLSLTPAGVKLGPGSAAIAAGLRLSDLGPRDWFGNRLWSGMIPSIGAHEPQTEGWGDAPIRVVGTSLAQDGITTSLTVATLPGLVYDWESSTDLDSYVPVPGSRIVGDGTTRTVQATVGTPGEAARFHRFRVVPE